jgi:hypothetical protein
MRRVVNVMPRPRFAPGESTPGTHWVGGRVDHIAGLDTEAREKIFCLCRIHAPVVQSVVIHYTRGSQTVTPRGSLLVLWGGKLFL